MNFDHWKDVEAVCETPRRAGGRRSVPIAREYTKMPRDSRKPGTKSVMLPTVAPADVLDEPSASGPHFVASDPAPDMDLAFANLERHLE